jgi:glycosyltransferase involved in cell wall biosynthesis
MSSLPVPLPSQYSAYVPCFNNETTIGKTLLSLQHQSLAPSELLLVDDCSTDGSTSVAIQLGIQVISNDANRGRGFVRAYAMQAAHHDLVVSCDATNHLPNDFVENALPWFSDPNVAAVFGRIWQQKAVTIADRWRARHLFKMDEPMEINPNAQLITYGCILRRSAVLHVGNFDPSLIHSEDAELGLRLSRAGYSVVFDPRLHVIPVCSNSISEVLERYWRWYAGKDEDSSIFSYIRQIIYSFKVLVVKDIVKRDFMSVVISILCPHYQFWRSWSRRKR